MPLHCSVVADLMLCVTVLLEYLCITTVQAVQLVCPGKKPSQHAKIS